MHNGEGGSVNVSCLGIGILISRSQVGIGLLDALDSLEWRWEAVER